jgi:hypothetical protein
MRVVEIPLFQKTEFKREVLAELQAASWMRDAGMTADEIAAHYQRDRDHRAAVIWNRRKK